MCFVKKNLSPFYTIFACVDPDPYSEYGSNTDPDPQHWFYEQFFVSYSEMFGYISKTLIFPHKKLFYF